ncbi:hypothetical protein TRVL_05279 [Trypanosoma vivax]|nr:hypothetical protein TRVL_05279 [Trypanosoma vivax]
MHLHEQSLLLVHNVILPHNSIHSTPSHKLVEELSHFFQHGTTKHILFFLLSKLLFYWFWVEVAHYAARCGLTPSSLNIHETLRRMPLHPSTSLTQAATHTASGV